MEASIVNGATGLGGEMSCLLPGGGGQSLWRDRLGGGSSGWPEETRAPAMHSKPPGGTVRERIMRIPQGCATYPKDRVCRFRRGTGAAGHWAGAYPATIRSARRGAGGGSGRGASRNPEGRHCPSTTFGVGGRMHDRNETPYVELLSPCPPAPGRGRGATPPGARRGWCSDLGMAVVGRRKSKKIGPNSAIARAIMTAEKGRGAGASERSRAGPRGWGSVRGKGTFVVGGVLGMGPEACCGAGQQSAAEASLGEPGRYGSHTPETIAKKDLERLNKGRNFL